MSIILKNRSKKTPLTVEPIDITLIDYDENHHEEKVLKNISEAKPYKDKASVTWIDIDGIHDPKVIDEVSKTFNLHPLVLEDILITTQRPKVEDYEEYLYVVLKMLTYDVSSLEIDSEQVSLILGPNYVISFQEKKGDVFDAVRERIKNGKGPIRKTSADHLLYSLTDAVVDSYFIILEKLGDQIDEIEEQLIIRPKQSLLHKIHRLRRSMLILRKSVWPLRELINGLQRRETNLVGEHLGVYLRDLYDHTIQIIDGVETYRDMLTGMLDTYLSSVSNRMNNVIRVLTIIATTFMPLTFVAGIYGMNFKYMPELGWRYGYPLVLTIMLLISAIMLTYFKRKKWF